LNGNTREKQKRSTDGADEHRSALNICFYLRHLWIAS